MFRSQYQKVAKPVKPKGPEGWQLERLMSFKPEGRPACASRPSGCFYLSVVLWLQDRCIKRQSNLYQQSLLPPNTTRRHRRQGVHPRFRCSYVRVPRECTHLRSAALPV